MKFFSVKRRLNNRRYHQSIEEFILSASSNNGGLGSSSTFYFMMITTLKLFENHQNKQIFTVEKLKPETYRQFRTLSDLWQTFTPSKRLLSSCPPVFQRSWSKLKPILSDLTVCDLNQVSLCSFTLEVRTFSWQKNRRNTTTPWRSWARRNHKNRSLGQQ